MTPEELLTDDVLNRAHNAWLLAFGQPIDNRLESARSAMRAVLVEALQPMVTEIQSYQDSAQYDSDR